MNVSNPSNFERVLIVGGGAMAVDHHVPRLKNILHSNQISIFENNPSRRAQLEARFQRDTKVELLHSLDPVGRYELVVIATPPRFHLQYFTELLEVADDFLIEKPMTMNADEAHELERISHARGKRVYVNLIRRTLRSYGLVKTLIASGKFGRLKQLKVFEGNVFNWKAVSQGSFSRKLNGGGVLMDTGPHTLDLLLQVFDQMEVGECMVDGQEPAIEANCHLTLLGDDSTPIEITLSRNRYLSNSATFYCELATLEVGVNGEIIRVNEVSGARYQLLGDGAEAETTWSYLVDEFYRRFLAKHDNKGVNPCISKKIAKLIDEAYAVAALVEARF